MTRLIALVGKKQSGKSTAADYLRETHSYTIIKFADPLKEMLRAIGLEEPHLNGDLKETPLKILCNQTPRYAMQTLGTEWGRHLIGEKFWINLWREKAKRFLQESIQNKVVVDDVRFLNEATAVTTLGGEIIRITRKGIVSDDSHPSETEQDLIPSTYTIKNNKSIPHFLGAIDTCLIRIDSRRK